MQRETPTGFIVTGSGTGNSEDLSYPHPVTSGQTFTVEFSAQSDGTTTSGTYTISVTGIGVIREGVLTSGTTDGSTYGFSGVDNVALCSDAEGNLPTDITVGIAGDCGEGVRIIYGDANTFFLVTGDVEFTLT